MRDRILVIIPTYNESANIRTLILQLRSLPVQLDILVIDDNSPDHTGDIVKKLTKQYPQINLIQRHTKLGIGSAYITGFTWALEKHYDIIIQMDADGSHAPSYLPTMLKELPTFEVVIGSRYTPGGGTEKSWGILRKILSRGGNFYARLITGLQVFDTTAGFKCFRASGLKKIHITTIKSDGYVFQIEVALRCQKNHLSIKEIPIIFYNRNTGKSKMSFKIIWEAICKVWLLKYQKN